MAEHGTPRYLAVDISSQMVDEALQAVSDLPVETLGITAFCEDLPATLEYAEPPRLIALLGNNFCNYDPDALLGMAAEALGPDDLLLFDAHVRPERAADTTEWRQSTERAYRSQENVRFNLGPLIGHGVDPETCSFQIDLLPLDTPGGPVLRTRKLIRVLADATARFAEGTVEFAAGDTLTMGFTYKYTASQLDRYLRRHSYATLARFENEAGDNLLLLVNPPSAWRDI
jgi:uncharacterized SAM-dependent methyltransferase